MPKEKKRASAKPAGKRRETGNSIATEVQAVLASLKRLSSKRVRDDMSSRYGIYTEKAFGVPMSAMQKLAKQIRVADRVRNHELAAALWETGWYEARTVAALLDDASLVTPSQMDRWCRDFDNWAICDTVCFKLFDRTPNAFAKVVKWSRSRDEFSRRAAFALMACLALHDKETDDARFAAFLPLIEQAASDDRNFVRKAVSWALRTVGRRPDRALRATTFSLAERLAASSNAAARWVGKDALRDLAKLAVSGRSKSRARPASAG